MVERDGQQYPFLVTNKHVVKGAAFGCLPFIKAVNGQPKLGESIRVTVEQFEEGWYGHPNPEVDVAVMPTGVLLTQLDQQGQQVFLPHLPLTRLCLFNPGLPGSAVR